MSLLIRVEKFIFLTGIFNPIIFTIRIAWKAEIMGLYTLRHLYRNYAPHKYLAQKKCKIHVTFGSTQAKLSNYLCAYIFDQSPHLQ